MESGSKMEIVTVVLRDGRELQLALEVDLFRLPLAALDPRDHVVCAVDARAMGDEAGVFRQTLVALGDRAHLADLDSDDPRGLCEDLIPPAQVAVDLLARGERVLLCASNAAGVELLAAGVLLLLGYSQPAAIEAIRKALPEAFPDMDSEIAVAVVEEGIGKRPQRAREQARNSL